MFANQMRVLQKTCSLVLEKIVGKFWTFWDNQAFSQTLKTGHPEGMFCHKIIRD